MLDEALLPRLLAAVEQLQIDEGTKRRCKDDFVGFIEELLTSSCAKARRVPPMLDNLNIQFRKSDDDVLGKRATAKLLRRVQFHSPPRHANWLNMAELEIGILSRHGVPKLAC